MNTYLEGIAAASLTGVSIRYMTDADILAKSHGRVSSPVPFVKSSRRPHPEGLLSSVIFGCPQDFICDCRRHDRHSKARGIDVCPHCHVPLTSALERRTRFGHIEIPVPVAHPWHIYQHPYLFSALLGLTPETVKDIAYTRLIVVKSGLPDLPKNAIVSTQDYTQRVTTLLRKHFMQKEPGEFPYKINFLLGGQALKELLRAVDLTALERQLSDALTSEALRTKLGEHLRSWLTDPFGKKWQKEATRLAQAKQFAHKPVFARALPTNITTISSRLQVVRKFARSGLKPSELLLSVIPVLPPDLRPMIPSGAEVIDSDLNALYRDVLTRCKGVESKLLHHTWEIAQRAQAYSNLQHSVSTLFDNGLDGLEQKSRKNTLKGVAQRLEGKEGRFRKNLFGKRVDFSGRSVIMSGPDLGIDEVGLPYEMARELFAPFTVGELLKAGAIKAPKTGFKWVARDDPRAMAALEKVMANHWVMLNRAPSLHRHSVQAFKPVLKFNTRAMSLNNVVTGGFNADYDGDQMGVHVAVTQLALTEVRERVSPVPNMLAPATGRPQHNVGQEAVLGLYYLTVKRQGGDTKRTFYGPEEMHAAWDAGTLPLQMPVHVRIDQMRKEMTYGRLLIWEKLPKGIELPENPFSGRVITELLAKAQEVAGSQAEADLLIHLRDLGFEWSTRAGLSFSQHDLIIPPDKATLIEETARRVKAVEEDSSLAAPDRLTRTVQLWTDLTNLLTKKAGDLLSKDRDGLNPFHLAMVSGARGKEAQLRQLAAMRGLFTRLNGEFVRHPVLANLKEGLNTFDYFVSCHGTRKSFGDMALKTAKSGYLTRRLVEGAHDLCITSDDCGDAAGTEVGPVFTSTGEVAVDLAERIAGRILVTDLRLPGNTWPAGHLVTPSEAKAIAKVAAKVHIRHPFSCLDPQGLCQRCYGTDLSTRQLPAIGLAVGVIAGQSVGEPGTQMTLRSKHTGGIAEITSSKKRVIKAAFDAMVELAGPSASNIALGHNNRLVLRSAAGTVDLPIPMGTKIVANKVAQGEVAAELPQTEVLVAPASGELVLTPNGLAIDASTGRIMVPVRRSIHLIKDSGQVAASEVIGEGASSGLGIKDITGGLPRIDTILEQRTPKDPALLSPVRGNVQITITDGATRPTELKILHNGGETSLKVGRRQKLVVVDGQAVRWGEKLTEGDMPWPRLQAISGASVTAAAAVEALLMEYRAQNIGVGVIHFETLMAALSRFARVEYDTGQLFAGEIVPRKLHARGGAEGPQVLLGLSKAALAQDGFLAPASFGFTRKVLNSAAIRAKVDPLQHRKARLMAGMLAQ